jgi:hypothetical protein
MGNVVWCKSIFGPGVMAIEKETELGCEIIGKWVCCKSYSGLAYGLGDNRVDMHLYN